MAKKSKEPEEIQQDAPEAQEAKVDASPAEEKKADEPLDTPITRAEFERVKIMAERAFVHIYGTHAVPKQ